MFHLDVELQFLLWCWTRWNDFNFALSFQALGTLLICNCTISAQNMISYKRKHWSLFLTIKCAHLSLPSARCKCYNMQAETKLCIYGILSSIESRRGIADKPRLLTSHSALWFSCFCHEDRFWMMSSSDDVVAAFAGNHHAWSSCFNAARQLRRLNYTIWKMCWKSLWRLGGFVDLVLLAVAPLSWANEMGKNSNKKESLKFLSIHFVCENYRKK